MIDLRKNDSDIIRIGITRNDLKIFKLIKKLNISYVQLKEDLLKCEQERFSPQLIQGQIIFKEILESEKEQHLNIVTELSNNDIDDIEQNIDNSKNNKMDPVIKKPSVWCEFVGFLGLVNVEHAIQGKSFIFKIGSNGRIFEVILFVHKTIPAFVTVQDDDIDPDLAFLVIKKHYDLNALLNYNEL